MGVGECCPVPTHSYSGYSLVRKFQRLALDLAVQTEDPLVHKRALRKTRMRETDQNLESPAAVGANLTASSILPVQFGGLSMLSQEVFDQHS